MRPSTVTLFRTAAAVLLAAGLGIIVLAFLNSPPEFQIALGLIGLGFLGLAPACLALSRRETEENVKYQRLTAKLEEITGDLKKKEATPGGSGVVIADIINAATKFYSDYTGRKEDEEKDA
jgi:hypothetical protein